MLHITLLFIGTFNNITKTHLFKCVEIFNTRKLRIQIKILIFFFISASNTDCGYSLEPHRQGGSNEYPQFMILSRNMKNNVYPCTLQLYYLKVGFKGLKLYRYVFVTTTFPTRLHKRLAKTQISLYIDAD